jgi:hypothetical protein
MQELASRLQLTPEQQAQIEPLVKRHKADMEEIRANLARADSRRSKRALLLETASIQEEFLRQLQPLLSEKQRGEWQKIRDELRKALKDHWRSP